MGDARAIVGFGEVLVRLSPPDRQLLVQAKSLAVEVGGAEANVLAGLAALGHSTVLISVVPDNPLGRLASATLRARGINTQHVNTAKGARMGLYFLEAGAGVRASTITYDREQSAFACASPEHFDFAGALAGARLLHMSGITPALAPNTTKMVLAAINAAKALGVPISFDGNYRAQLWQQWDSDARTTLSAIVGQVDILFGNHRDIALLTGQAFVGDGSEQRRDAAEAAFRAFPGLMLIASTARTVITVDYHDIAARVDSRSDAAETDVLSVHGIIDRVGTGDAFAAGVLHGWLRGDDCASMAQCGLALAALKHSLLGDMSIFGEADLERFANGQLDLRR